MTAPTIIDCPQCGNNNTWCSDSRQVIGRPWRRRRRRCRDCDFRWSTLEVAEHELAALVEFHESLTKMHSVLSDILHEHNKPHRGRIQVRGKNAAQIVQYLDAWPEGAKWNPNGVY